MKFTVAVFALLIFANFAFAEDLMAGLGFVRVPEGTFMMGSKGRYKDERPIHNVAVKSFLIMDHELTYAELKKLIKTYPSLRLLNINVDIVLEDSGKINLNPDYQLPVELTWVEATTLAAKLSEVYGKRIRLPTEAEWEYAARGGLAGKQYPWGNKNDKVGGTTVDSLLIPILGNCSAGMRTMPVGRPRSLSPKNNYGLYDMAGNVWEWTSSLYRRYPYNNTDGREGPGRQDDMHVVRGGGQADEACDVSVSLRGYGSLVSSHGVRYVAEK